MIRATLACGVLFSSFSFADGKSGDETYKQLELFARVLSYVQNNYVEPVNEQKLVHGAIRGMLETLDPHTVFMPPDIFKEMKIDTSGEFGGLGLELVKQGDQMVVIAPVDDTPAFRAGIKAGDLLTKIGDEPTRSMDLPEAVSKMRGPAGTRVMLTIMRDGFSQPREFAVIRDHIRIASVEAALYGQIAHVKVKNFQERTDAALAKELDRMRVQNGGKELRGVVLDLRNNPGGLLDQAVAISDRFLPGNLTIVSTRGRNAMPPGEEKSKDRDTEKPYPLVVLVNAGSASASEIVAGALQDHRRAAILGLPTFGKGSVQTIIEMEDGSGLKLTVARYFTPSGRSIQERGITPDFVVGESEGSLKSDTSLREKDLKRHFKGETPSEEAKEAKPNPPALQRSFAESERIKDYQLKIALNHVNALASGVAKNSARVGAGDK
jgi:carboxyl-terminal processing protease